MHKSRIEAFSDGVLAIVITVMVLEMKVPHGTDVQALKSVFPVFLSYALSFIYIGIYWNNHHHLFQAVKSVKGGVLWANLHLLFWLSLLPFSTGWLGEHQLETGPAALYGGILLMAAIAWYVLTRVLLAHHGPESALAKAMGSDFKGRISIAAYVSGVGLAFVLPWIAVALYVAVAALWIVPDRRVERVLLTEEKR